MAVSVNIGITKVTIGSTEIDNVHNETWDFHEEEPETVELINQCTGKPYYVGEKRGKVKVINFQTAYDCASLHNTDASCSATLKSGSVEAFQAHVTAVRQTTDTAILWNVTCREIEADAPAG
jgi:hypothetical protein